MSDPQTNFDLVESQFTMAQAFATSAHENATTQLESILDYLAEWEFTPIEHSHEISAPSIESIPEQNFTEPVVNPIRVNSFAVPTWEIQEIEPGNLSVPGTTAQHPGSYVPYTPQYEGVPTLVQDYTFPEFEGKYNPDPATDIPNITFQPEPDAPEISFPDEPSVTLRTAPTQPSIGSIPSVTAPTLNFPPAPVFETVSVPEAPEITIAEFNGGDIPVFTYEPAVSSINVDLNPYRSDLLDTIKETITTILQNGGVTLTNEVAQAIWDNGRNRVEEQLEKSVVDTTAFFASRGWVIPPGAAQAIIQQAYNERDKALNELNNNIVARQGELAVTSFHQALQHGVSVESLLVNHAMQLIEASLAVQKATVDTALAVFNARIAQYNAQMEGYKTYVYVYKTKIEAQGLALQLYDSQIRGAIAFMQFQTEKVNVYKAQVEAEAIKMEAFKAEVSAISLLAEIEKLKIDMFKAQIEAYVAQTQVDIAQYQLYQAKIAGVEARVRVYSQQVEAYKAMVQTKAIEVDTYYKKASLILDSNKNLLQKYIADIEKYKTDISVIGERNKAYLAEFSGQVEVVKLHNAIENSRVENNVKGYMAEMQGYESAVKADAENIDAAVKGYLAKEQSKQIALQAKIASIDGEIKVLLGQLEAEKLRVSTEADVNDSNVKAYLGQIQAYATRVGAMGDIVKAQALAYDAMTRETLSNNELQISAARANTELLLERNKLLVTVADEIAKVSAQLAAGALGSVNAAAHSTGATQVSYDETRSEPTYQHVYNYTTK